MPGLAIMPPQTLELDEEKASGGRSLMGSAATIIETVKAPGLVHVPFVGPGTVGEHAPTLKLSMTRPSQAKLSLNAVGLLQPWP
eukprot:6162313-Prymnesium_polylepis.1